MPVIVKLFLSVAGDPPGFVTTTFHYPGIRPAIGIVQVIFVGVTTTFVAIQSVYPVRVSLTVAPVTKPVPGRFVMVTGPVFGAVWSD